jgi:hypothetical protein
MIIRVSRVPAYLWRLMKIGEACFIPRRTVSSVRASVKRYKDLRFDFRRTMIGGQIGCKVTRLPMLSPAERAQADHERAMNRLRAKKERALIQLRKAEDRIRKIDAAIVAEKLRHVGPCSDGGRMNENSIGEA